MLDKPEKINLQKLYLDLVDTGKSSVTIAETLPDNCKGIRYNQGKPQISLVPPEVITAIAMAFTRALESGKYPRRNWEKGMVWSNPYDSLFRHMLAWNSGEDIDPETQLPHLWLAAANISMLIAYAERGLGHDNRGN